MGRLSLDLSSLKPNKNRDLIESMAMKRQWSKFGSEGSWPGCGRPRGAADPWFSPPAPNFVQQFEFEIYDAIMQVFQLCNVIVR